MEETYFTPEEQKLIVSQFRQLLRYTRDVTHADDVKKVRTIIANGIKENHYRRDKYGINPTIRNMTTALLLCEKISPDRNMIITVLLYNLCKSEFMSEAEIREAFGDDIFKLISGMLKVSELYRKRAAVKNENFRNLLFTFANDIRVVLIMIVDRLGIMRMINHHPNEDFVRDVTFEAINLYAPLAHRLGLYTIKSELEDLSLKYSNRDIYTRIADKLNETKEQRNKYIDNFIAPVKEKLEEAGLKFDIKGRTKSIYSIWNKIQKQNTDLNGIFDLFAIRVIIDTPLEKEKSDCWLAYSIIVDLFTSNPARMKDWITVPKSNGYESLHTTVHGPDNRWVEVQIRTRRMDEVAEKGLAAHWKYKGVKSEKDLDDWAKNVRELLEMGTSDPMELMKSVKMDIYNKEVFAFTPKGDLYRLPGGASLLDFAFMVHSKLGCMCTGGRVDGKNQKLNYKIKSGDTIEILTSSNQIPKLDWLNFVVTSKARNKIKQAVNELNHKNAEYGKELLMRRFKNRKIDVDEATLMRVIKKFGTKTATDFFNDIHAEKIAINDVINTYLTIDEAKESPLANRAADEFELENKPQQLDVQSSDVLVIGEEDIKGINYKMSRCCNPFFGDDVVGFISSEGVIKIHRADCPNVKHLESRFPYRKIDVRWSGKGASNIATLKILGNDNIGIVTGITSIITKESRVVLRNISIDSYDGMFQGYLVVGYNDKDALNNIIKKINDTKGVKNVQCFK